MTRSMPRSLAVVAVCCVLVFRLELAAVPAVGPETEKRFPPLVLPDGFTATLFACDPLLEYPSVIARGPRVGAVFVAYDYMTGLGQEISRRDEVRLVEDTDGDGYADQSNLFAGGFNSIMGLAYDEGAVYVMHAPFLTSLRDSDGDGVADERRDLLSGLGLTPEENPVRLHCANGVTVGYDGWLYLALGDHGSKVDRPEGDRLVYNGGGILRCRLDGSDLHVFATGLRNIYEVALDADLNPFVRDNENDGGDYMIRVCHTFFGSDHGYPYDYYERPRQPMAPLADLARGSSAGVVCYSEPAFPPAYRNGLIACEWGRSVVRYPLTPKGSGFAPTAEFDLAAGAATDPYGFKPTSLVVDDDGSLLVADWADGQRPKRGRGRLYRIRHVDAASSGPLRHQMPEFRGAAIEDWITRLDDASSLARREAQGAIASLTGEVREKAMLQLRSRLVTGRLGVLGQLHMIWIVARSGESGAVEELLRLARTSPHPRVVSQAIGAIADLTDPVFLEDRLQASRGDSAVADRLAEVGVDADPLVQRAVVMALGRLRWVSTADWVKENLTRADRVDEALSHAAAQALRRVDTWTAVVPLLDAVDGDPVRGIALRAVADQYTSVVADALIERLAHDSTPRRRRELIDVLARLYKMPGPWTYWGYRPKPRAPHTESWERTEAIGVVLSRLLDEPDRDVRAFALGRMMREGVPVSSARLSAWLAKERAPAAIGEILNALAEAGETMAEETRDLLVSLVGDPTYGEKERRRAIELLAQAKKRPTLRKLAPQLTDGPVLAALIGQLGDKPEPASTAFVMAKLDSPAATVRLAAVEAVARWKPQAVGEDLVELLVDPDEQVRRAATVAVGQLTLAIAAESLLDSAVSEDAAQRSASLESLGQIGDVRAVPLASAALADPTTRLAAIRCLTRVGGAGQVPALLGVCQQNPSLQVLEAVAQTLAGWRLEASNSDERDIYDAALATVQGLSGTLIHWRVAGPMTRAQASQLSGDFASGPSVRTLVSRDRDGRLRLDEANEGGLGGETEGRVWLARAEIELEQPTGVEFLGSSAGSLQVSINGHAFADRHDTRSPGSYSHRFQVDLPGGRTTVMARVDSSPPALFQLRFRRRSASVRHERLTTLALSRRGTVDGGRELFFDVNKSQCLKCHRLRDQGGRIGPDLTGVGSRFSPIHLIESVLDPSRTIAASFHTVTVVLADGRVVTGVKLAETERALTLGDAQGQVQEIEKSIVQGRVPASLSTMPEGLEKALTDQEFVDLIAFLLAQR